MASRLLLLSEATSLELSLQEPQMHQKRRLHPWPMRASESLLGEVWDTVRTVRRAGGFAAFLGGGGGAASEVSSVTGGGFGADAAFFFGPAAGGGAALDAALGGPPDPSLHLTVAFSKASLIFAFRTSATLSTTALSGRSPTIFIKVPMQTAASIRAPS